MNQEELSLPPLLEPVDFKVETQRTDLESVSMRRPGEVVVSVWTAGLAKDDCAGEPCDLVVEGKFREVRGYDPMNGTEMVLEFSAEGGKTRVAMVTLLDYPILWRFVEK